jgi:hypothetical protein
LRLTEDLSAQLANGRRFQLPSLGTMQRCEQSAGVPWRSEQVGGLNQAREFIGWNEGNASRTSSANYDNLLLIRHLIQNAGQILAQARVGGFSRVRHLVLIVQEDCT